MPNPSAADPLRRSPAYFREPSGLLADVMLRFERLLIPLCDKLKMHEAGARKLVLWTLRPLSIRQPTGRRFGLRPAHMRDAARIPAAVRTRASAR